MATEWDQQKIAIHAAYRIAAIDVMLSSDVQGAMPMPGIFIANLEGEREMRLRQLSSAGVDMTEFAEWRVGKERPKKRKTRKRKVS